ncbi:hypothetical protein [Pseudomonas savastanoi]|uniref:hypothetical protein n=1 Tax=Pseudomonas savastanoi TaxID=29438 RepID=UPI0012B735B9|nr:hypothetical protein [Pseudomonas savastanoi]
MSKHYFTNPMPGTTNLLEAELGWDAPMQVYYCNIWELEDIGLSFERKEDPVYSYFSEKFGKPLQHYLDVCEKHGIPVPDEIVNAIKLDQEHDCVNEVVDWDALF